MIEPKVSLTLILPGSNMVSQQEAENKPKDYTEPNFLTIRTFDEETKKVKKETLVFNTRKSIDAAQVLKISQEAYEAMPVSYTHLSPRDIQRSRIPYCA